MTNGRLQKRPIFGVMNALVWEGQSLFISLLLVVCMHTRLCSVGDLTAFGRVIWDGLVLADADDAGDKRRR